MGGLSRREVTLRQATDLRDVRVALSEPTGVVHGASSKREGMFAVKKFAIMLAAVVALALSATVQAKTTADGATVTRATLASGFIDANNKLFPATCDETQVITQNQRREMFNCTFDAEIPPPIVCDTATGCFWFSDFDGKKATSTHFVITQSGQMVGWATY
jgi:hypothetical protein